MEIESLNHFKSVTVHQFFIEPADNDYLLARWMLINRFSGHFWHVSQAIEKYLKAGLVINDCSVKKWSHSILKLYEEHLKVFDGLALRNFSKPDGLNLEFWADEAVEGFILRINRMGSPDSRYGLTSWSKREDDLFKIDQLIWSLRRLTIGLNWCRGSDFDPSYPDPLFAHQTYLDALLADAALEPRGSIKGLKHKLFEIGPEYGDLLHSWNYSFRRNEADISKPIPTHVVPNYGSFLNSYLTIYWEILNAKDTTGKPQPLDPLFIQGMNWLIDKIKLQKKVEDAIKAQLALKRK